MMHVDKEADKPYNRFGAENFLVVTNLSLSNLSQKMFGKNDNIPKLRRAKVHN